VRFALTAGQRGDCPQAYGLIEGLPAQVVMAMPPTTPIPCARRSPTKAPWRSSPTIRPGQRKYPLDKHLYAERHLIECCFSKLKQSGGSQRVSKRPPENYLAIVHTRRNRPMASINVHRT